MDTESIVATTSKILDAHKRGRRDHNETVALMLKFHGSLSTDSEKTAFFNWLLCLIQPELGTHYTEFPTGKVYRPSILRIILRTSAELGRATEVFAHLFSHLSLSSSQPVLENWYRDVLHEMQFCMLAFSDRQPTGFMPTIKGYCALYTRSEHPYTDEQKKIIQGLKAIEEVIAEKEFCDFERSLDSDPNARSQQTKDALAVDLERFGASKAFEAMHTAREYLNSSGTFDPKNAAGLIRSAIDEVHRIVVDELSKHGAAPYSGPDKDGARRSYMQSQSFISKPEEEFFSAIYKLVSSEGVHALIAPKETIVVLHRTVSDYLMLLLRRLSEVAH